MRCEGCHEAAPKAELEKLGGFCHRCWIDFLRADARNDHPETSGRQTEA